MCFVNVYANETARSRKADDCNSLVVVIHSSSDSLLISASDELRKGLPKGLLPVEMNHSMGRGL